MEPTISIATKFPSITTTIFTKMSALAQKHHAVNLGQGFPDFDCDAQLVNAVTQAMQQGHNQYPPMPGLPALRKAVSDKVMALYGKHYDPDSSVTITAGATQAILTVILAVVRPGDEVVVLEPTYDSYAPNIEMAGGTVVRVPLDPGTFRPNFAKIAAAIGPRTRLIIINTPHNPSATVWTANEMQQLEDLLRSTSILVLSDEVYEHMVYDGGIHQCVARWPDLARRAFVVSSFGKTYHVTGWKVGFVAAPPELSAEFRKVHQFNVFTVNTPMQVALANYMGDPTPYMTLARFYQAKRDRFLAGLSQTRFQALHTEGTYFQCVDYRAISDLPETDFCEWLTTEVGVAAIPLSAFYQNGFNQQIVRFCFAKRDETLDTALARLAHL